jgi:hypothetical protein
LLSHSTCNTPWLGWGMHVLQSYFCFTTSQLVAHLSLCGFTDREVCYCQACWLACAYRMSGYLLALV